MLKIKFTTNWHYLVLIAIIGWGIFLDYDYLIHSYSLTSGWPDEKTYLMFASFIVSHGILEYLTNPISYVNATPGYPIYLSILYKLFDGNLLCIRLFQIFVISGITLFFIYKIGEKVFDKVVGLLAVFICAVYVYLVRASPTLLTEPIFFLWVILGVYCLVGIFQSSSRNRKVLYSLFAATFLAFATLTRPVISGFPIFLLVVGLLIGSYKTVILKKRDFSFFKRILPVSLLCLAFILPLPLKNYIYFGEFKMAPGGYVNCSFYLGTRADTEGDEPPYRKLAYDCNAEGNILKERALNNITEYHVQYIYWNLKKIGRLLVGSNLGWFCCTSKDLIEHIKVEKPDMYSIVKLASNVLLSVSIAIFGLWGAVRFLKNQQSLLLVLMSSFLILFSILGMATIRYGLPIFLINSILASAGFLEIVRNFKRHYDLALFATFLIITITLYVLLDDLHFVLILAIVLFLIRSVAHTRLVKL